MLKSRQNKWANYSGNKKATIEMYLHYAVAIYFIEKSKMQTYKAQLTQMCAELKIPVEGDFRASLLALTDELPVLFEEVGKPIQNRANNPVGCFVVKERINCWLYSVLCWIYRVFQKIYENEVRSNSFPSFLSVTM